MQNQKLVFEMALLFFVALLGGIISTIIFRLEFTINFLLIFAGMIFLMIVSMAIGWEIYYARHRRTKDHRDKKETRNNTREILKRMNER